MLVVFGVLTISLFFLDYPAGTFDLGNFHATPFFAQFGVVAGYQISWAIYVSDYSRYLPPDVTVRKTFYWTYWGSALGGALDDGHRHSARRVGRQGLLGHRDRRTRRRPATRCSAASARSC